MDPADHRKLVDDFERQAKVAGLLAILRQFGIMRYGPATPTPEQDLVTIGKLSAFTAYKVLSWDQIQRRLGHELSLDGSTEEAAEAYGRATPVDRHLHREWLATAFTD
jgi:hypothetical protein